MDWASVPVSLTLYCMWGWRHSEKEIRIGGVGVSRNEAWQEVGPGWPDIVGALLGILLGYSIADNLLTELLGGLLGLAGARYLSLRHAQRNTIPIRKMSEKINELQTQLTAFQSEWERNFQSFKRNEYADTMNSLAETFAGSPAGNDVGDLNTFLGLVPWPVDLESPDPIPATPPTLASLHLQMSNFAQQVFTRTGCTLGPDFERQHGECKDFYENVAEMLHVSDDMDEMILHRMKLNQLNGLKAVLYLEIAKNETRNLEADYSKLALVARALEENEDRGVKVSEVFPGLEGVDQGSEWGRDL